MTKAYCVKCKEKVEIEEPELTKSIRGVNMVKGKCSICKGKVCKMGGL